MLVFGVSFTYWLVWFIWLFNSVASRCICVSSIIVIYSYWCLWFSLLLLVFVSFALLKVLICFGGLLFAGFGCLFVDLIDVAGCWFVWLYSLIVGFGFVFIVCACVCACIGSTLYTFVWVYCSLMFGCCHSVCFVLTWLSLWLIANVVCVLFGCLISCVEWLVLVCVWVCLLLMWLICVTLGGFDCWFVC